MICRVFFFIFGQALASLPRTRAMDGEWMVSLLFDHSQKGRLQ